MKRNIYFLALLLLATIGSTQAAIHTITKVYGKTISLPAYNAGDTLCVIGDALQTSNNDWEVLRTAKIKYYLELLTENTIVPGYAFSSCDNLIGILLPKITNIEETAFSHSTSLTTISLPVAISIGDFAFYMCISLRDVSQPEVRSIGEYAFQCCYSLTTVLLPQAKSIGSMVFAECNVLNTVSLPKVENIGESAFNNCTSLTTVLLPRVGNIGEYAFYNCSSLTTIALPNVERIDHGAFSSCSSLTVVLLPKVKSIGSDAFWKCTSLTAISLPKADSIGQNTFKNCISLKLLQLGAVPPNIGYNCFSYLNTAKLLLVPSANVASYKLSTYLQKYPVGTQVLGVGAITDTFVLRAPGEPLVLESGLGSVASIGNKQWFKNGTPLIGATDSNYTISQVSTTDNGYYTLRFTYDMASNGIGIGDTFYLTGTRVVIGTNPVITGVTTSNAVVNIPFSETFAVAAQPDAQLTAFCLPTGSSLSQSSNTEWKLSGIPQQSGVFYITLFAENEFAKYSGSSSTHTFILTVNNLIFASASAGGSIIPIGDSIVARGSSPRYTITPNTSYRIDSLLVDGINIPDSITGGSYTFNKVISNHSIRMIFKKQYILMATAGRGGSISPNGTVTVDSNSNKTFTITPNIGYRIDSLLVDGINVPDSVVGGSYTFTNITDNHSIHAVFKTLQYTLTASAGNGGSISPNGIITVDSNSNKTFTIIPNTSYQIDSLLVDGVNIPNSIAGGSYTFTNIIENHSIRAVFRIIPQYTLTASAGNGGSISPNGISMVDSNSNKTFTITPNTGYRIDSLLVDGVNVPDSVVGGSYTFTNVTENHSIRTVFKMLQYTLTASAGNGGSISPNGISMVDSKSNKTFTITASTGYRIDSLLVDGVNAPDSIAGGSYTFTNVTENHSIRAVFKLTTGIGDIYRSKIGFTVYPNPAREYANLKIEGVEGNIELSVTTVNGELVKEETFRTDPNAAKQISLQGLAKGTYYVRILHKDWVKVEKLIVN